MRLEPTNIQQIGNELAIQWNDGIESYLDLQFLRRACPCAACGGEPDVLGNIMSRGGGTSYSENSFELAGFDVVDGYQFAASSARPKLTFQQLETLIRRDPIAQSQPGRMEFGSVRMEEGTALAEVMFVSNDGRVQPFLYKLLPERNSWKIVNVQRMWFVPRSHLLRGVRA